MLVFCATITWVVSAGAAQTHPVILFGSLLFNPGGLSEPLPHDFPLTKELIERVGLKHERHQVITEDGYVLALHRILNPSRAKSLGVPVLFAHGFASSSDLFLFRDRENALPFLLSDEGYDVWLGDFRGNFYSRSHVHLSPDDPSFWNFTFHEMGVYDLPAFVDHILKVSGQPKLILAGYSLGGCSILVMNSMRPEYNDKIHLNVLLGPGPLKMFPEKTRNPYLKFILKNPAFVKAQIAVINHLQIHEFLPRTTKLIEAVKMHCRRRGTVLWFCANAVRDFYGDNLNNLNKDILIEVLARFPAGTSTRTLVHMSQIISKGWYQFDWGERQNKMIYNSTHPPRYPLERVTSPHAIAYGANDYFSPIEGIKHLATLLRRNVLRIIKVPDPRFSHFDYILGLNAKEQLYSSLLTEIARHTNKLH